MKLDYGIDRPCGHRVVLVSKLDDLSKGQHRKRHILERRSLMILGAIAGLAFMAAYAFYKAGEAFAHEMRGDSSGTDISEYRIGQPWRQSESTARPRDELLDSLYRDRRTDRVYPLSEPRGDFQLLDLMNKKEDLLADLYGDKHSHSIHREESRVVEVQCRCWNPECRHTWREVGIDVAVGILAFICPACGHLTTGIRIVRKLVSVL